MLGTLVAVLVVALVGVLVVASGGWWGIALLGLAVLTLLSGVPE